MATRHSLRPLRTLLDQPHTVDRFGGIVIAADAKAFVAIAGHGVRRQRDDRALVASTACDQGDFRLQAKSELLAELQRRSQAYKSG